MPKQKSSVWKDFKCVYKEGNSGKWAVCKACNKEMQGIPQRMLKHYHMCVTNSSIITEDEDGNLNIGENQGKAENENRGENGLAHGRSEQTEPPKKKPRLNNVKLSIAKDSSVISTSPSYAQAIDLQVSRYFFATNTPFKHVEHTEFKKMCSVLRPGYKPPSRKKLGSKILEEVYEKVLEECKEKLNGQVLSMSLDGWSNIHNDPIVCCSVSNEYGESYLIYSVNPHTAEYLKTVAFDAIKHAETCFEAKIKSIVTDNTGNVANMRRILLNDNPELDAIQYGCSAHILHLLAEDMQIKGLKEHIIKVIKYFRNKHLPSAWYKERNGKMLVIPQEIRWNTVTDSLKSYLDNRGILVQICQDHKDEIDMDVFRIVNDTNITVNAKDFLRRMEPIAVVLDRMQRDGTTIAVSVEIWRKLEKDLTGQPPQVLKQFKTRKDMALTPSHYLANLCDHRFRGLNLTNEEKHSAFEYLETINRKFIPVIMALSTKSKPFPAYMFGDQFKTTPSMTWWKSLNLKDPEIFFDCDNLKPAFLEMCLKLLTAVGATAGLERIFSTFGLVHSKLRNRLGTEKVSKLTFIFRCLNQDIRKKSTNLDWAYEMERDSEDLTDFDLINPIQPVSLLCDTSDMDSEMDIPLKFLK